MNDICGINRITPFQGLDLTGNLCHRALPYANDNGLSAHTLPNKAESLIINSVGHRPTNNNNSVGHRPTNDSNNVRHRPTNNNDSVGQHPTNINVINNLK